MKRFSPAFSLIEVLVATSLLLLLTSAIVGLLLMSLRETRHSSQRLQALTLAQEGEEAMRLLRDNYWSQFESWSAAADPKIRPADPDGTLEVRYRDTLKGFEYVYLSPTPHRIWFDRTATPPAWKYALAPTASEAVNGMTRQITVAQARRLNGRLVDAGGIADPQTRRVTVRVTYRERGDERTVELVRYLTNYLE